MSVDESPEVAEATAAPRRRGGPIPRLSPVIVADAVITVGFDQASLVKVAGHLGVAHAALYRHIGDRDGMMAAAIERLTATYRWPELVDSWSDVLWNECRAWWALCEANPGFVDVLASTPGLSKSMARRSLVVSTHLTTLGVTAGDAFMVVDLAVGLVHNVFRWASQRQAIIEQSLALSPEETADRLEGVPPEMLEVIAGAMIGDSWPWFAAKLELIVDGLATRVPPA